MSQWILLVVAAVISAAVLWLLYDNGFLAVSQKRAVLFIMRERGRKGRFSDLNVYHLCPNLRYVPWSKALKVDSYQRCSWCCGTIFLKLHG